MADGPALKTFDELVDEDDEYLQLYEALPLRSPHDGECATLVREIIAWLHACVGQGCFVPTGSPERRMLRALVDGWTSRLRRDGHVIEGADELLPFDPKAGVVLDLPCPYPGLEAYGESRSTSFFGRETLSESCAAGLESSRIFLIVGGSGAGKSSVALAGVLPILEQHHPDWLFSAPFTPGTQPLLALAEALPGRVGHDAAALADALCQKPQAAPALIAAACGGKPAMLLIDQFEELITLCRDPAEQKAFAEILVALSEPSAGEAGWQCHILITLRTDHLARFENRADLKPLHARLVDQGNYAYLPAMNADEIRRAIIKPAEEVRLRFVPSSIPERLASQTAGLANGLPLLQFALRRLWDTRPRDPESGLPLDLITQDRVDALPDVPRALGKAAEEVFQTLTKKQQEICERLMQELVLLDENFEEPLRRRRSVKELKAVLSAVFPGTEADVEVVLQRFYSDGLLRIFGEDDNAQIEVAHEALLRHWERINQVVSGHDAKRRLHTVKQVAREATEWAGSGRKEDFLKQHGEPLEHVLAYVKDGWFADAETQAYVKACQQREEEARKREQEAEEAREAARRAEVEKAQAAAREADQKAELDRTQAAAREAAQKAENDIAKAKVREAQALAKRQKQWFVTAGVGVVALLVAAVAGRWVTTANENRDASLGSIASLGERLPPWEGLDVAYNLAAKGGADYRFALSHALERMDDAWIVGERSASATLVGNGAAVLQIEGWPGKEQLDFYGWEAASGEFRFSEKAVSIPLTGQFARLRSMELGPVIKQGAHKGQYLLVMIFEEDELLRVEAYLLDFRKGGFDKLQVKQGKLGQGMRFMSGIDFHPDGDRAIWSFADINYQTGQIVELRLGRGMDASLETKQAGGRVEAATAVAYLHPSGGGERIVTARAGRLFCDGDEVGGEKKGRDDRTVLRIATAPEADLFALGRGDGRVAFADCKGAVVVTPSAGDAATLRLGWVDGKENKECKDDKKCGKALVASYLDVDRQLHCFMSSKSGTETPSWGCNPGHSVGAAAMLDRRWQAVVERSGVASVRFYPNEGATASLKALRAGWAGGTTIRWGGESGATWAREENSPQALVKSGQVAASLGSLVTAASLSPDGKRMAWVEREGRLIRVGLVGGAEASIIKESKDDYAKTVLAVDNRGRVAYAQGPSSERPTPVLYLKGGAASSAVSFPLVRQEGELSCLNFSPNEHYLVMGTPAGVMRVLEVGEANLREIRHHLPGVPVVPVTSCAVANDRATAIGYNDGTVRYVAADGAAQILTRRAVYAFPAPVREVRIDEAGGPVRRLTALGGWQINNCVHPGLPGQAIRAWELSLPDKQRATPLSVACFPNEPIAALGGWSMGQGKTVPGPPGPGKPGLGRIDTGIGLNLITATGTRWHACPACSGESEASLSPVLDLARRKGAKVLEDQALEARYGFKIGRGL